MYRFSHNGITVASMLDTRRQNEGGGFPVKIRVTFRRDRQYYSTGKTMTLDEWSKLPTSKTREASTNRAEIQAVFSKVCDAVVDIDSASVFSFSALRNRLGRGVQNTINKAFVAKMEALSENGRVGTELYYKSALKNVEDFGGENIPFSSITTDWLRQFDKFMSEKGRNTTTKAMYMRAVRAVVNNAIREGVMMQSQYPFGKGRFEIQTGEGRKLALTMKQIWLVKSFEDCTEAAKRSRDLWYFSYLINGLNFADLLRLQYNNIQDGEVVFVRSKTLKTTSKVREIRAILSPDAQEIIKRWGSKSHKPTDRIFPFIKSGLDPMAEKKAVMDFVKRTNGHLKVIGEAVGVSGLSTYAARHSFATVLKRSGANIAFISESLGHADTKTTKSYLDSFERSTREEAALVLTKFDEQSDGKKMV